MTKSKEAKLRRDIVRLHETIEKAAKTLSPALALAIKTAREQRPASEGEPQGTMRMMTQADLIRLRDSVRHIALKVDYQSFCFGRAIDAEFDRKRRNAR